MTNHTPEQLAERLVEMKVISPVGSYWSFGGMRYSAAWITKSGGVAFAALEALRARGENLYVHVGLERESTRLVWYEKDFSIKGAIDHCHLVDGTGPEALIRAVVQAWEAME